MVDFQERDTRRSPDDDDEDDDDDDSEASPADDATTHEGSGGDSPAEQPDTDPPGENVVDDATTAADPIPAEDEPADHDDHDDHGHSDHDHDHADDAETHDEHDHDHSDHDHDHSDHDHDDHSHGHHAHDVTTLGIGVVTVSSTRTLSDDPSGDVIQHHAEERGHEVVTRDIVRDDYDGVQSAVDNLVGRDDVDVVVTTGGTGVTPDDVTIEAVEPLFEKELPGFGELFRLLSHEEIGTKVVATRATAGIADGCPVFCLPGSENAARLGIEEIILEEAPHLAGLATRE